MITLAGEVQPGAGTAGIGVHGGLGARGGGDRGARLPRGRLCRNAARLTRKVGTQEVQLLATFKGGMWSRHGGGTRGRWTRLQFLDWGIRLDGRSLIPTFELRYDEISEARLVASRFKSGIRFQSSCLTEPVTFETSEGMQIADLLEERGVMVNRNVGHLGWLPGD